MNQYKWLKNSSFVLGFLVVLVIVLSLKLTISYLSNPAYFPINIVKVVANYDNVTRREIEQILTPYTQRSFFSVNSHEIATKIKRIPWVKQVNVRKKWPASLIVNIREFQPYALWNDNEVVTNEGLKFKKSDNKNYSQLPQLIGIDKDFNQVLHTYQNLSKLVSNNVFSIKKLINSPSQLWRIETNEGVIIELGSIDPFSNFSRLNKLIPLLNNEKLENIAIIDLRYPHGIAIRWKREIGKT